MKAETTVAKGLVVDEQFPPIPDEVDQLLVDILKTKRRHDSPGETKFRGWLVDQFRRLGFGYQVLETSGYAVNVPMKGGRDSDVLFSCHIDTVHQEEDGVQVLEYDPTFGHIFLGKVPGMVREPAKPYTPKPFVPGEKYTPQVYEPPKQVPGLVPSGSCLGADDGAGIWIMLKMIEAKVPGTYIFHRGEERGGIGSKAIAARLKTWLQNFSVAVAFDRPNEYEVITHQGGVRCASDKFAKGLCAALNTGSTFTYRPSDKGVYTDTKEYRRIIAECVNLGVGYQHQHGASETLDYGHLVALKDQCVKLDWTALPVDRDPSEVDDAPFWPKYRGVQGGFGGWGDDGWEPPGSEKVSNPKDTKTVELRPVPKVPADEPDLDILEELRGATVEEIEAMVESDPTWVAEAIQSLCLDLVSVKAQLDYIKGK